MPNKQLNSAAAAATIGRHRESEKFFVNLLSSVTFIFIAVLLYSIYWQVTMTREQSMSREMLNARGRVQVLVVHRLHERGIITDDELRAIEEDFNKAEYNLAFENLKN